MVKDQPTIKNLLEHLDEIAAFSLAESWDNVGLMVGSPDQEVTGILVGLDPTEELLEEAMASGLNTIITHHPLIFSAIKSIRTDHPLGKFLTKALSDGMAVISCHTNLDVAPDGVSDILAGRLGLQNICPLSMNAGRATDSFGFGRIGRLVEPMPFDRFVYNLLHILQLSAVKVAGCSPDLITKVAVCGGSGSELAELAYNRGAEVYITGEVKHSVARWAEASKFCMIDAGHYATENTIIPVLVAGLEKKFSSLGLKPAIRASAIQANPFAFYIKKGAAAICLQ